MFIYFCILSLLDLTLACFLMLTLDNGLTIKASLTLFFCERLADTVVLQGPTKYAEKQMNYNLRTTYCTYMVNGADKMDSE